MKKYYSIGEVADLLGISTQTLRYYNKIGVVKPAFVNENTGYRQYSYDQIQYIERIKYLQGLGLELTDIREALLHNNPEDLVQKLVLQNRKIQDQIHKLTNIHEVIAWYIEYYQHIAKDKFIHIPIKKHFETRYVLAVPIYDGEPLYGKAGIRLTKEKCKPLFQDMLFLRQNGYILDFESLLKNKIKALFYYVYIKDKPQFNNDLVKEIPRGEYFCFRVNLLSEAFQNEFFSRFFDVHDNPRYVIANEIEDNFCEFYHCSYDVQILIPT